MNFIFCIYFFSYLSLISLVSYHLGHIIQNDVGTVPT